MSQLPSRLADVREDAQSVEIGLVDPVALEGEAIEALKQQGGVTVSHRYFKDLAAIGLHVRGVGVLKTTRGLAVLTQRQASALVGRVVDVVLNGRKIDEKVVELDAADLQKVLQAAALVINALTRSQQLMVKVEQMAGLTQNDDATPPQKPFEAGVDVTPPPSGTLVVAKEVHMHGPANGEKSGLPNDGGGV